MDEKTIFELSRPGTPEIQMPEHDLPEMILNEFIPEKFIASAPPPMPEVSEFDVIRHFTRLSNRNYNVDANFYPLGSCTMKYNPRVGEWASRLHGFAGLHPYAGHENSQGALKLMEELSEDLCEITGMDSFTLQPAAGAHGELTALLITRAWFKDKGEERDVILVPDTSHGTNPASAAMAGFNIRQVKSDGYGNIDIGDLKSKLDDKTACLMLTNPSTLGLFETGIEKVESLVHKAGGLLYYDGANLNALMGKSRPGDMGFDLVHLNLHKTFATPHGGGGPGSGPVGALGPLADYLPGDELVNEDGMTVMKPRSHSIGRVRSFYGNFGVLVKAYVYIRGLGAEGLVRASECAVLSANYLATRLREAFELPYKRRCMHEFVLSASKQKKLGVSAMDIAKRILDFGYHAPTVYFPLIVPEALMIEPTETENKQTMDAFCDALLTIAREVEENPEIVKSAPHNTTVSRVDEAGAARKLMLCGI